MPARDATAIGGLKEPSLTRLVILPLLEAIHPGRVEYTHSSSERGRDVISFGKDSLKRPHILAVQVKTTRIPYGAAAFGLIRAALEAARTEGVTLENGTRVKPHEAWLISSSPFPEQSRFHLADQLKLMEDRGIKVIGGEELTRLVQEHIPDALEAMHGDDPPPVQQAIRLLLENPDTRAFGLITDKTLDDYYVTATLSHKTRTGFLALAGRLKVTDAEVVRTERLDRLVGTQAAKKLIASQAGLPGQIRSGALSDFRRTDPFIGRFNVECTAGSPECLDEEAPLDFGTRFSIPIKVKLASAFSALVRESRAIVSQCPDNLPEDAREVLAVADCFARVDAFVHGAKALGARLPSGRGSRTQPTRIRIEDPLNLLNLGRSVLLDGPPGCGKTTLMKILAIQLLKRGIPTSFVPCHRIRASDRNRSLHAIVRHAGVLAPEEDAPEKDRVLLLDGLDEAPFPLADKITRAQGALRCIVSAARTAFIENEPMDCFGMSVAPFTREERDAFLTKWLGETGETRLLAHDLIRVYEDIDLHTRLPLIGTVFVALLLNGLTPMTRSEIYDKRLELLLYRWDRARGVDRLRIDDPEAKRRFLLFLAFRLHTAGGRRRVANWADLEAVNEQALGAWSSTRTLRDLVEDLVVGHGLLIRIGRRRFSLGHLTFQEHLAGEFLYTHRRPAEIVEFFGDDWWNEPLNFYASLARSLDPVLEPLQRTNRYLSYGKQLREMLKYARYTGQGACDCIEDAYQYSRTQDTRDPLLILEPDDFQ